jgi:hypothetical protein
MTIIHLLTYTETTTPTNYRNSTSLLCCESGEAGTEQGRQGNLSTSRHLIIIINAMEMWTWTTLYTDNQLTRHIALVPRDSKGAAMHVHGQIR